MGKLFIKIKNNIRLVIQVAWTAVTNGYIAGFAKGSIFTGASKAVCLPGLNCYSCPGALGACPMGALQSTFSSEDYSFAFYAIGFLMIIGAVGGKFVCGFLCPFGLVQDVIYKIPFVKKLKKLPGDRYLKWIKFIMLILFAVLLPLLVIDMVGLGKPWFCEYICPSGTLFAGIPLTAVNEGLRNAAGGLFVWKISLLCALLLLSLLVYRPFCRYVCPLGAVYGMFNPVSLVRYKVDHEKCTACGICRDKCKMDIAVFKTPNNSRCVRCGDCIKNCPKKAVSIDIMLKKRSKK